MSLKAGGAWAANLPMIEFSIKPRLCVLADDEQECHDVIEIKWHSAEARSLCLYQNGKKLPLRCWEDELSGTHSFRLSTTSNIDFHLKEMHADVLLVTQAFEVVHDNKKFRRRRRNAWSFF